MLATLAHLIIQFIQTTGYFGIFILMTLESALIPIPSEVTMPFSGFLASQGTLSLLYIILVGTFANLVGSLVAFSIGYFLEETVLLGLINKFGKFILLSESDFKTAEKWFEKFGGKIVLISRLLPGIRTVISLPAGVFRMDLKKFILYTFLGSLAWSAVLTYIGFVLGENWNRLEPIYQKFEIFILIIVIAGILIYLEKHLHLRKKFRKTKPQEDGIE